MAADEDSVARPDARADVGREDCFEPSILSASSDADVWVRICSVDRHASAQLSLRVNLLCQLGMYPVYCSLSYALVCARTKHAVSTVSNNI